MSDAPTAFRVDQSQSQIWVEAKSSLHPIHGEGRGLEGQVKLLVNNGGPDLGVAPQGSLSLRAERLSSGNPIQDMDMRRRIEVNRYPTIVADLREVKALEPAGRYRAWADLVFHGVTRRIPVEVTAALDSGHTLTAEGQFTLDVRSYGVTPPSLLGLKVHPEVKVRVRVVARQEE